MKKLLLCSVLVLAACSTVSQYTETSSDASMKAKMHSCLVSEANTRFQAGTLFDQGVQATAEVMVNSCLKKLALESAGISAESQSTAQSIIEGLKGFGGAN